MGLNKKEYFRRKISSFLIDTSEQNPLKCTIIVGEDEAFGLSTLQMPTICEIFQIPGEGIIYYKLEGTPNFEEIETLTVFDLIEIYKYLKKL
jgi:hypothetical protein